MRVRANYFDGITSRLNPIELEFTNDTIVFSLFGEKQSFNLDQVRINDALGSAYLSLELPNGRRIECPGLKNREQLGLKKNTRILKFLEQNLLGSLASLIFAGVGIWATAVFLLPLATDLITPEIPSVIFEQVDELTLSSLDTKLLIPSTLSDSQKNELMDYFDFLNGNSKNPGKYHLEFRATKEFLPNAFALSGSTIVVTDDLVNLLQTKELVGAILAHELGHHQLSHIKKSLVRISTATLLVAVTTGDFSNTIGQLSTALWQLSLSREDEFAADEFGGQLIKKVGGDPVILGNGLQKLETAIEEKKGKSFKFEEAFKLISTHPDTAERVKKLEQMR